jgi:hypothetical protein
MAARARRLGQTARNTCTSTTSTALQVPGAQRARDLSERFDLGLITEIATANCAPSLDGASGVPVASPLRAGWNQADGLKT